MNEYLHVVSHNSHIIIDLSWWSATSICIGGFTPPQGYLKSFSSSRFRPSVISYPFWKRRTPDWAWSAKFSSKCRKLQIDQKNSVNCLCRTLYDKRNKQVIHVQVFRRQGTRYEFTRRDPQFRKLSVARAIDGLFHFAVRIFATHFFAIPFRGYESFLRLWSILLSSSPLPPLSLIEMLVVASAKIWSNHHHLLVRGPLLVPRTIIDELRDYFDN